MEFYFTIYFLYAVKKNDILNHISHCKRFKMAQPKAHDRTRPEVVDEEDPVEKMLMKTGCIDLHYAVQVV